MTLEFKEALTQGPVLNNGVKMPWLGLGVWETKNGDEVINAVKAAVASGYRSIDTASFYKNEEGVGRGIIECGVPREQLFITTKVWNTEQGYDKTLKAFEESRKRLKLEYLDLYLIHWPIPATYRETWKALIHLYNEGYVRAIGVSNFEIHHLNTVIDDTGIIPAINQVELHPLLTQKGLLAFSEKMNVRIEAWRPLMKGRLDNPVILDIAKKYSKTPAQVILRWDIQCGIVTIPKSIHENRIAENAQIFDFKLSDEDMKQIDNLNQDKHLSTPPQELND